MISKSADYILLGKNFFSLLFAIESLLNKKSALMVGHEDYNYSNPWPIIGMLEIECLRLWGEKNEVTPLMEIEKYITKIPREFCVGNRSILLFDSFKNNYREISRAFAGWPAPIWDEIKGLDEEQLQVDFESFNQQIAKTLFYSKGIDSISISGPINQAFSPLRPFLRGLEGGLNRQSLYKMSWADELLGLLVMARANYQQVIGADFSQFDCFHMGLGLLSPQYELDVKGLTEHLEKKYLELGGEIKLAKVSSMQFQKRRPWRIELDSFEGVLHPRYLGVFTPDLEQFNLRANMGTALTGTLKFPIKMSATEDRKLLGPSRDIIVGPLPEAYSLDAFPLAKVQLREKDSALYVAYGPRPCFKTDFIGPDFKRYMKALNQYLSLENGPKIEVDMEKGEFCPHDLYRRDLSWPSHLKRRHSRPFAGPDFRLSSSDGPQSLKNIFYMGRMNQSAHGQFLSTFISINNYFKGRWPS